MFLRRTPSLLLTCCAFIALLLVNVSVLAHAHMRADAMLHGAFQHAPLAIETPATGNADTWQGAGDDAACGDCMALEDGDIDDEPALLSPGHVALDYLAPAAPAGAAAGTYHAPTACLLRPPRQA